MGNMRQNAAITLAIVAFQATLNAGQAAADRRAGESRLRIGSEQIARLVGEGEERSRAFRSLIAAIERTDGLVYISDGPCVPRVRACLLMQLDQAGPNRMLRIHITLRRPDDETIVAIGHELQHAMEVLGDTRVRTTRDMFLLYQRIGLRPPSSVMQFRTHFRFETAGALRAGETIRDELEEHR